MKTVSLRLLLSFCSLFICFFPAHSGQIPSHIYTALASRQFLTGIARDAVNTNLNAYLSGAQGPDICGVVMPKLNKASWFTAIGEETHYDPLKAELALNMLDCAQTPREKAYALGWMSHYINDIFIHELINSYGGFYEKYDKHHKLLEQLENKHVYAHFPEVIANSTPAIPVTENATFAGFIFDAYHRTFPDNAIYQQGNEWFVDNRPYFCARYNEAASWCAAAGARFLASHQDGTGKHGYEVATLPFPNMPSKEQYDNLTKAIEITNIATTPDNIKLTIRVNDNKLYGRFNVEWNTAAQTAIQYANQVFTFASQYLNEKKPDIKAEKRRELLAVIPDVNLDQPRRDFDYNTALPGDIAAEKITYQLTLSPKTKAGKTAAQPLIIEGLSTPITLKQDGFGGSKGGEVTFDITLPADSAPYTFTLKAAISGKQAMKIPEFREVDWTQADGSYPGSWLAGAGNVALADTFTVRFPLPKEQQTQTAAGRRYLIVPVGYNLLEEDIPMIRARMPREGFRYDVTPIKETIENETLTATLQVTGTSPYQQEIIGAQSLMMLWIANGKIEATTEEILTELTQQLEEAQKAMEEINKLMGELINEEQQAQLEEEMMKFQEELAAKNTPEDKIEQLMQKKAFELMKQMGIDTKKVEELNARITADMTAKMPFYLLVPIQLTPVNMQTNFPGDWTIGEGHPTSRYQNVRSASYEHVSKDEEGRTQWRSNSSINIDLGDDKSFADAFKARNTGDGTGISVAGYSGKLFVKKEIVDHPYTETIVGEALLWKGKVYLHISYTASATGYNILERDKTIEEVAWITVYEGKGDAIKAVEDALKSIESCYQGVIISPSQ